MAKAEGADRYLREIRTKISRTTSYEHIYDETLAEFWVFNYLHGRTFLSTRETLLAELRAFVSTPATPHDAYEMDRFRSFRQRVIESLISRFESGS